MRTLQQVAEWIKTDAESHIYYVHLNGFDTHVQQRTTHDALLQTYATGVSWFN
ncbi:MAG: hypothetical protein HC912_00615 [Saprospiraceae bacterium]|nr:hypothetical protein [Saprospiraceae bacterium]